MLSALLITHSGYDYVLRKVSPKVLEQHIGDRLAYYLFYKYIITSPFFYEI